MIEKARSQLTASYRSAPSARYTGWVMRPCWPSQYPERVARSARGCAAKNSGVTRRSVASSATALAPFSQNSAVCRLSPSGQAQPGQSKPSFWLTLRSVRAVRATPICCWAIRRVCPIAGRPAAACLGGVTCGASCIGSPVGGLVAIALPFERAYVCSTCGRVLRSLHGPRNEGRAVRGSPALGGCAGGVRWGGCAGGGDGPELSVGAPRIGAWQIQHRRRPTRRPQRTAPA